MEVFYTFTWAGNRPARADNNTQRRNNNDKPRGKGKHRGKGGQRGDKGGNKAQNYSAKPPRKEKQIDPDNPFAAALMGLKDNS